MTPMDAILAERRRQIEVEGWTPEHDYDHEAGRLLRAAVIYLWHGTIKAAPMQENGAPLGWPWEASWWKPKDRRSNLIRAGALALAEKERVSRAYARRWARRGWPGVKIDRGGPFTGHVDDKLGIIVRELESLEGVPGA